MNASPLRVLMLVATSVATDTRVLREATTLAAVGHPVHIIGKQVPAGFVPPVGVTVSSAGASSVFRRDGAPSLGGRRLPPWTRLARWVLLPLHRNQAFARWAREAEADAVGREFDVVHAHDFTALALGHRLARARAVPLVYDSHELWSGRPRSGRPTPLQKRRERHAEGRLGADAEAVLTVGDGVARALEAEHGWSGVRVVRNSFPFAPLPAEDPVPRRLLYTGRLAPYRELEVIAAASRGLDLPVDLIGPADDTWLAAFDRGACSVRPPLPVAEVAALLREAGVALVTHSDRWPNHRLAMPNKLFHAVSAGVPVVATDVGELALVVRAHGLGTLYTPGDPNALAAAVRELLTGYDDYVRAVRRAVRTLSWEADADVLLNTYRAFADSDRVRTPVRPPDDAR